MFCENCGAPLREGMGFCENCGAKCVRTQPEPPKPANDTVIPPRPSTQQGEYYDTGSQYGGYAYGTYAEPQPQSTRPAANMDFKTAVKDFFSRYADFKGRTVRSGYWWIVLLNLLVSTAISTLSKVMPLLAGLQMLYMLAIWCPSLALSVRRLHDIGRSGKWLLLALVPVFGWIILIVWACQESGPDNAWGPAPEMYASAPYDADPYGGNTPNDPRF